MNTGYTELLGAVTQLAGTVFLAALTWAAHAVTKYISSRNELAKNVLDSTQAAKMRDELADITDTVTRYTEQTFVSQIKSASADGKLTPEEAATAAKMAYAAAIDMIRSRGLIVGSNTVKYAVEAAVHKLNAQKKTVTLSSNPLVR